MLAADIQTLITTDIRLRNAAICVGLHAA